MDDDIEDPDDIMCNFIPMVKEYLTCKYQEITAKSKDYSISLLVQEKEEEKEEDYVYDVYYRDDNNLESGINSKNVGSLVWFDDQSEYLDDDSDSELGDYVDEDSNGN
jgi:hypothetical protein